MKKVISLRKIQATVSYEICEIFTNTFCYRTPPVATFETKHIHAPAADLLHIKI